MKKTYAAAYWINGETFRGTGKTLAEATRCAKRLVERAGFSTPTYKPHATSRTERTDSGEFIRTVILT